jgi:predicted nucleic acid-binding protein
VKTERDDGGPGGYVVDASVGIKLFVAEPLSDRADALFAQLTAQPPIRLYVPDLFYSECANILWKYVRRFGYPRADAQQAVADLVSLNLRRIAALQLLTEALGIAISRDVTAYDACYVALADRLRLPLITADESLARKLAGTRYDVQTSRNGPTFPTCFLSPAHCATNRMPIPGTVSRIWRGRDR